MSTPRFRLAWRIRETGAEDHGDADFFDRREAQDVADYLNRRHLDAIHFWVEELGILPAPSWS